MTINVFCEILAMSPFAEILFFRIFEKRVTNTCCLQKKKDAPRKTGASSFGETSYEWNQTPIISKLRKKHGPGTQILFCKPKPGNKRKHVGDVNGECGFENDFLGADSKTNYVGFAPEIHESAPLPFPKIVIFRRQGFTSAAGAFF